MYSQQLEVNSSTALICSLLIAECKWSKTVIPKWNHLYEFIGIQSENSEVHELQKLYRMLNHFHKIMPQLKKTNSHILNEMLFGYAVDNFLEYTMYIGSERPGLGDISTACRWIQKKKILNRTLENGECSIWKFESKKLILQAMQKCSSKDII